MFATWLNSFNPSTNLRPAVAPPFNSNAKTAPAPLGAYFFAVACQGHEGSPA